MRTLYILKEFKVFSNRINSHIPQTKHHRTVMNGQRRRFEWNQPFVSLNRSQVSIVPKQQFPSSTAWRTWNMITKQVVNPQPVVHVALVLCVGQDTLVWKYYTLLSTQERKGSFSNIIQRFRGGLAKCPFLHCWLLFWKNIYSYTFYICFNLNAFSLAFTLFLLGRLNFGHGKSVDDIYFWLATPMTDMCILNSMSTRVPPFDCISTSHTNARTHYQLMHQIR